MIAIKVRGCTTKDCPLFPTKCRDHLPQRSSKCRVKACDDTAKWCTEHRYVPIPPSSTDEVSTLATNGIVCKYNKDGISCENPAIYGDAGGEKEDALYCKEHHDIRLHFNIVNPICIVDACKWTASYRDPPSRKREYCSKHGPSEKIRHTYEVCGRCGSVVKDTSFLKIPPGCHKCIDQSPLVDTINERKELRIRQYLSQNIDWVEFTYDKPILGVGCGLGTNGQGSLLRPDALGRLVTHALIIEADEGLHGSHTHREEYERNIMLYRQLNQMPLIIVRLGHDAWIEDGYIRNPPLEERLPEFVKFLNDHCREAPKSPITVYYKCYNPEVVRMARRQELIWPHLFIHDHSVKEIDLIPRCGREPIRKKLRTEK
jgi:hypothetical protein